MAAKVSFLLIKPILDIRQLNFMKISLGSTIFYLFIQMSMNAQVLHRTSVTPTLCAPTLKDPTYVAVVVVTKETVEIAQVFKLLCIANNFMHYL